MKIWKAKQENKNKPIDVGYSQTELQLMFSNKKEVTMELKNELKFRWSELCKQNFEKSGDIGSCVLGAQVELGYTGVCLVSSNDVAMCQGSLNWEVGLSALLKELETKYSVKLYYNAGRMD
jgi:hypothetical protein